MDGNNYHLWFNQSLEGGIKMLFNAFIEKMQIKRNGAFIKLRWRRQLPVYKRFENQYVVEKVVESTIRKGLKPNNVKGQREVDGKLPWGQWKKGYEGFIIEHNNRNYARVFFSPNEPKIVYYINGIEIDKEELKAMNIVTASGWNEIHDDQKFFCLNIDTIEEVGQIWMDQNQMDE